MKFAHMADCHIGGWRDPKMRDVNTKAFLRAIQICIAEQVDFVIIAGDLFNTSIPGVECLRMVTENLKKLYDNDIPCYIIAGSHDFSPSGKTMLDVLESAGLCINVAKGTIVNNNLQLSFTQDPKTKIKLAGIIGKKGGLDKNYYKKLIKENLEQEKGEKIFVFHTSLTELKPEHLKEMDSEPVTLFPRGFNYYAGGHVHIVEKYSDADYPNVVYPGPLFPNNFSELEKLHHGGFYIVEDWKLKYAPLEIHPAIHVNIIVKEKTPEEITAHIEQELAGKKLTDAIVTIHLSGMLSRGKAADIDFKKIFDYCYSQGAYIVLRNTHQLESKEFQAVSIATGTVQDVEERLIEEHTPQQQLFIPEQNKAVIKELMKIFMQEKKEGERVSDFENRTFENADNILKIKRKI